jgi:hypothetical protein
MAFADRGNPIVADVALEATSKIPIDFVLKGTLKNPREFASHFGIEIPDLPAATLNLAGGLGRKKMTVRKLSLDLGGNDFSASGAYDWSGKIPKITLNLKSTNINMPELFPDIYKPGPKWIRPKRPLNVFKDVPLYSHRLREYDADISIDVTNLHIYRNMSARNIYAKGALANGALDLRAGLNYAGGDALARVRATDVNGGISIAAAGAGRSVHIGRVFESIGEKNFVSELPMDFEFYAEGGGETLSELVANTWGHANAYSTGLGYAHSELVAYLYGQDFLTFIQNSIDDAFRAKKKHNTVDINCVAANLKIRAGRIETDRGIAVGTAIVNIRAKGWADFGKERLKVAFVTTPVRGLKLSISGNVVNSLEITGNLAEPDVRVSGTKLVSKVVTATGIGLFLAPFTGGLSLVAGAGVGLLGVDLLESWVADSMPCHTAREQGAPSESGDPEFMRRPVKELVEEMINSE